MKHGRSFIYILGGVGVAGALVVLVGFVVSQRLSLGVKAGEITLSDAEIKKGTKALQKHKARLEEQTFTVTHQGTSTDVTLAELGVTIEVQKTLEKAKKVRTAQSYWQNPLALFQEENIDIQYSTKDSKLRKTLTEVFQGALQRPRNASYSFETGELSISSAQAGRTFDINALHTDLQKLINGTREDTTLSLSLQKSSPNVTENDLQQLQSKVAAYVDSKHVFGYADKSWTVPRQKLLSWFTVEKQQGRPQVVFHRERIRSYLKDTIAEDVNRSPRNANIYFNPQTEELKITRQGWEGRTLHAAQSLTQFLADLRAGESQTDLVVNRPKPDVYRKNLENIDISTKLGSGSTTFGGSSASRINNIKVSAQEMSGSLVMPGEEFSFVGTLGPVAASTGYEPEIVIKNGQNVPEYGGGICQVSTTMFRTVMNTSLEITARQNHSYIIPIYGKPGFDATIYQPRPDFAFKNTTDNPILIQHQLQGTRLTFNIYGSPNNKHAEVKGPYTLQKNEDGTTKTVVHRNVYNTQTGNRLDRDSFYSYYEPRNNFETVTSYE
jgi:vancomycin resistance protein YoaR